MSAEYISHEKLGVIREYLEESNLKNIPLTLQQILWRAEALYTPNKNEPEFYLTDSEYDYADLMVQFDKNGEIESFIIFNDYTGEYWNV